MAVAASKARRSSLGNGLMRACNPAVGLVDYSRIYAAAAKVSAGGKPSRAEVRL